MANPMKAEFTVEAGGKAYTLAFSMPTIIAAERKFGRGTIYIASQLEEGRFEFVLGYFHLALQLRHRGLTEAQALEIIEQVGWGEAARIVGEGIVAAMPKGSDDADPLTAPEAGIGTDSSSPGAN